MNRGGDNVNKHLWCGKVYNPWNNLPPTPLSKINLLQIFNNNSLL